MHRALPPTSSESPDPSVEPVEVEGAAAPPVPAERPAPGLRRPGGSHPVHAGSAAALLDAPEPAEPEGEGWLITYLDMITLLLVMLVVMLAFAGGLRGGTQPVVARQADAPATPVQLPPLPLQRPQPAAHVPTLPDLGADIEVLAEEGRLSFRISSEILFDSGQADLSRAGLALLQRLLPVLRQSPHPIAVHGHTDPLPIRSARFPSNWELSGARAGSVVRYLEANGIDKQRLRAVGLADIQPIADNASAEGRALNRRVELVLEQPLP